MKILSNATWGFGSRKLGGILGGVVAIIAALGFISSAGAVSPDIDYKIQARHSQLYLDVLGQNQNNGANVGQWDLHEGKQQTWRFIHVRTQRFENMNGKYWYTPIYRIRAMHSGLYLDVLGQNKNNGANVGTWGEHQHDNQLWFVEDTADGYVRFKNVHSLKYLDVLGRSMKRGANVGQWKLDPNGFQQQFKLVNLTERGEALGAWFPIRQGGTTKGTVEMSKSLNIGGSKEKYVSNEVRKSITTTVEGTVKGIGLTVEGSLEQTQKEATNDCKDIPKWGFSFLSAGMGYRNL